MKAQTPLKPSTPTLRRVSILVLLSLLALILPGALRATDYTWTQTAGGSGAAYTWTNTASWTPAPAVGNYPGKTIGNYDTVDFRVAMAGNQTVIPRLGSGGGFSNCISSMKIGGTNGTYTYTFDKGGLTTPRIAFITSAGADARLEKSGNGNDIFATGGFTLGANLDVVFTGGTGTLSLPITIYDLTNKSALNISGVGTLYMTAGNSSYSGGTSIQQTTVEFASQSAVRQQHHYYRQRRHTEDGSQQHA